MCICVPVHVCPICSACAPPLLCVAARAAPPLQLCSRCHAAAAVPPWVRFFFAAVLRARPCAVGGPGRAGGAGYPGRYPARPMPPRCRCASVLACCTRGYRWARSSASLLCSPPIHPAFGALYFATAAALRGQAGAGGQRVCAVVVPLDGSAASATPPPAPPCLFMHAMRSGARLQGAAARRGELWEAPVSSVLRGPAVH